MEEIGAFGSIVDVLLLGWCCACTASGTHNQPQPGARALEGEVWINWMQDIGYIGDRAGLSRNRRYFWFWMLYF